MELIFDCTNTQPATIFPGLNTLLLSASATPVPNVVALAATLESDGIVKVQNNGVFAVATVNLGAGDQIVATAEKSSSSLPVTLSICETDPVSSVCLAPPVPGETGVATSIGPNDTPTFGVFAAATQDIPLDAANSRVYVRFRDDGGEVRGATSVAIQTVDDEGRMQLVA